MTAAVHPLSMRNQYTTVLIALVLSIPAAAQPRRASPVTIRGGAVRFVPPSTWQVINHSETRENETVVFQVPNPADEDTPDSANAGISVSSATEQALADFANNWIAHRVSQNGGALLERYEAGHPTADVFAFYRWQQGATPYVAADRFSKRGKFLVQISVAWPILSKSSVAWSREMIAEANRVLSQVEVNGTRLGQIAKLRSRVVLDNGRSLSVIEAVRPNE